MATDSDQSYGAQFYDALCEQGGRSAVTSRLGYAQIQELKSADRAGVAALLSGSSSAILKRVANDPPELLAAYMCGFFDGGNLTDGRKLILAGLIIS